MYGFETSLVAVTSENLHTSLGALILGGLAATAWVVPCLLAQITADVWV